MSNIEILSEQEMNELIDFFDMNKLMELRKTNPKIEGEVGQLVLFLVMYMGAHISDRERQSIKQIIWSNIGYYRDMLAVARGTAEWKMEQKND